MLPAGIDLESGLVVPARIDLDSGVLVLVKPDRLGLAHEIFEVLEVAGTRPVGSRIDVNHFTFGRGESVDCVLITDPNGVTPAETAEAIVRAVPGTSAQSVESVAGVHVVGRPGFSPYLFDPMGYPLDYNGFPVGTARFTFEHIVPPSRIGDATASSNRSVRAGEREQRRSTSSGLSLWLETRATSWALEAGLPIIHGVSTPIWANDGREGARVVTVFCSVPLLRARTGMTLADARRSDVAVWLRQDLESFAALGIRTTGPEFFGYVSDGE